MCLSNHLVGQESQIQFLSGTGSDTTVDWEFRVSGGRNSGAWSTIAVPSNWEMQGFGTYRYGDDWSQDPAPDSVGLYRLRFTVPAAWQDGKVDIVFGGSMTDTEVRLNGTLAGPIHQGGFYEFRYDVTTLLEYGRENLLEVKVSRYSSNTSVNLAERRADFWLFSGLYRPVWLEALPPQHITRVVVDARHTGDISIEAFVGGITTAERITAQVRELNGQEVGSAFAATVGPETASVELHSRIMDVAPWSAEWPHLYLVELKLDDHGEVVHTVSERFGFRTVEVRPRDGLYVNDVRVRLKGVNRHSFWPTTGRTTSKELSIADASLIKDMNMNAVRMSHYPPDRHFLDVADSLGLYVIDELTGWQDAYDTEVGTGLVREMVLRDVNHPSIILWANGNEGGWNPELVDEYARWDPQQRTVIQPRDDLGGINTSHYETYDCCPGTFFRGDELFMPTEFLHGLYDGGHGAGLDDWWDLMLRNDLAVGGFLWAFADEGIVRADMDGAIDVAGNRAPDGIVGPFREREGSFYAIKETWSPVYVALSEQDDLPPTFDGILRIENRYDHTDLTHVRFHWQLVDLP
ncbi:MAG: glycoside hydrolase family 2, partial [Gemmatimonadales bacterium]|nr:glycoside hydrolase family 2 [Gemmatimonadales bacterium]